MSLFGIKKLHCQSMQTNKSLPLAASILLSFSSAVKSIVKPTCAHWQQRMEEEPDAVLKMDGWIGSKKKKILTSFAFHEGLAIRTQRRIRRRRRKDPPERRFYVGLRRMIMIKEVHRIETTFYLTSLPYLLHTSRYFIEQFRGNFVSQTQNTTHKPHKHNNQP